ncbi:MAG: NRDE family protein [Betaproteobacteria bacterium]|nr:NRDE family protein [Betaproteobacteria bacterium]
MCLILFAHKAHPKYPLILAANRDEAYARPAAPAGYWDDHPDIYGGRDLDRGGTWLGLTRSGKVAAVTNFRNANAARTAPRSRGELVSAYLAGGTDTETYLGQVEGRGDQYNGFILIAGELDALYWLSNRGPGVARIAPGVHGLSNHLLNTPWPKIKRSKLALEALLGAGEKELTAGLFQVLSDRSEAPDHELPDTGVGLERERQLSANFISGERYGTRASTVLLIDAVGGVLFVERSFGAHGKAQGEITNRFRLDRLTTAVTSGRC